MRGLLEEQPWVAYTILLTVVFRIPSGLRVHTVQYNAHAVVGRFHPECPPRTIVSTLCVRGAELQ